ncbi:hypothetical protein CDD80_2004 [Ophiocordyceps camponoti-rufipedis]|uniref:Ubiquitin carboxyl-terminal hydrolase n=1 Tax=Ophiocordyceps camponoti-rufipedis TaxID=2004952 RepID=A0A2C5YCS7_9HYPO|nr:hypothetical protein CDD80_2004 [Ophiocordyceps camponoti-rufipedis]
MARRQNTSGGHGTTERTAPAITEQALEEMAERVADKAIPKVLDAISDRFVTVFEAKIQAGLVERIAASVAERLNAPGPAPETENIDEPVKATLKPEDNQPQTLFATVEKENDIKSDHSEKPDELDKIKDDNSDKDKDDKSDVTEKPDKVEKSEMTDQVGQGTDEPGEAINQPQGDESHSQHRARSTRRRGNRKRSSPDTEGVPPEKKPRTTRKSRPSRNPETEEKVTEATEGRATRSKAKKANNTEAECLKIDDPADETDDEDTSDFLLLESLKPLSESDIEAWTGWAEVESEPAFFNLMLRKLGVKGLAFKELVTLEPWGTDYLPAPVHGLVFLFQYSPQLMDDDDEDCNDEPVWFANQTTNNSCASVALMNIVMNAENVDLGEQLQAFKNSTMDLSTSLRGNSISNNAFIRTVHNSFVRRMDQLNADLSLAWEVDASNARGPAKNPAPKRVNRQSSNTGQKKTPKKLAKPDVEYGFHFIAYVPAGGYIWELDGMRVKPQKIGVLTDDPWTDIARARIQHRVQEYGEGQFGFSLLAVCRSPFVASREMLIWHMAALYRLRAAYEDDVAFGETLDIYPDVLYAMNHPEILSDFNVEASDIDTAEVPADVEELMQTAERGTDKAMALINDLAFETRFAMNRYRDETQTVQDEARRVACRQNDYTPALHLWMTKLAELGVLENIIGNSQ